jgi:hypothetical protein
MCLLVSLVPIPTNTKPSLSIWHTSILGNLRRKDFWILHVCNNHLTLLTMSTV